MHALRGLHQLARDDIARGDRDDRSCLDDVTREAADVRMARCWQRHGVMAASQALEGSSRAQMIDALRRRGIVDSAVLAAMAAVPRELFVMLATLPDAYADTALDIGHGQTISAPYVVAVMAEALRLESTDHVLEVGTGTGYAAAVLSMLAARVYTIERIPALAAAARERLAVLGYRNIEVRCGDGTRGWLDHAPYQAIVCTAADASAPWPLLDQLDLGGRLVMPLHTVHGQTLVRITRVHEDAYATTPLGAARFTRLVSEEGWPT